MIDRLIVRRGYMKHIFTNILLDFRTVSACSFFSCYFCHALKKAQHTFTATCQEDEFIRITFLHVFP